MRKRIHIKSSRRQWWRRGFFCAGGEIFRKFLDKTLGGPGAGFSEGADSAAGNVIRYRFQSRWILHHAAAEQHSIGNLFHPERALTAGGALSTRFVGIELVNVVKSPDHVARVIQHNDAARARHRAAGGK